MNISDNMVVGIHYTLKNDDGEILDSSDGGEPLQYLHGARNIILGLEKALQDKNIGDQLDVTVEAEEGYGERRPELIQEAPRSAFQGVEDLEVGMQFQAQTDAGPLPITITKIEGDMVTVDGNHALAGIRLHFSVTIDSIRQASEEEISHGHVH